MSAVAGERAAGRSASPPISSASRGSSGARACASSISASGSSRRWSGRWCGSSSSPPASARSLGISIIPPYETYVLYDVYITPGLIAMIQLFNGMQSSLSMVYDREMGSMRMLLVSPAPRWFLLTSKLLAGVAVSILQVYAYLVIAYFWEIEPPPLGLSHDPAGAACCRA